jgi:hypothetical protein
VPKHRIDAPDTLDSAIHLLAKLQSEGWCLKRLDQVVDFERLDKKAPRIPVGTTITIKLIPSK